MKILKFRNYRKSSKILKEYGVLKLPSIMSNTFNNNVYYEDLI